MDATLIELLLLEVKRQILVVDAASDADPTSYESGMISLKEMGTEYSLLLSEFSSNLADCLNLTNASDALLDEIVHPRAQLFWQIPAFSGSSLFLDPKRSKERCEAIQSFSSTWNMPGYNLNDLNISFWNDPILLKWASAETSSLLLLQGSYQSMTQLGDIALKVVDHLEINNQPVIYTLSGEGNITTLTAQEVLRQVAIQILQKNKSWNSIKALAFVVERFQSASSSADWFGVIDTLLEGISHLYMVIDFGFLGSGFEAASSWPKDFQNLFERMERRRRPAILKIILLSCRPFLNVSSSTPVIVITSPFMKRERLIGQQPHETGGRRGFPIPVLKHHVDNQEDSSQSNEVISCSSEPQFIIGEVAARPSKQIKGPRDWFFEMKEFEKCIDASRKEPDDTHPRVKVAVLDTGVDLSHPDIAQALTDGRFKFYDFVEDSNDIKDLDGHGTHCTSLVLKYAPNAEVYAGRVFRKGQAEPTSCATLTKAICHAVEKWQVNIISLSIGFSQDDDKDSDHMRHEIRKASGNSILIFAAAANNTTNEPTPIRFPARMREGVFCIFSSNSYGRPSDFNPPSKFNRPNFIFPGERIEGAWPANLADSDAFQRGDASYKLQDGTSCATPIAAAVAAGVLEFAWQEREPVVRRAKSLEHHSGMTELFLKRMVDDYKVGDNGYHYVKPWKLISIRRRKDEIPVLMSDTMDHIDG